MLYCLKLGLLLILIILLSPNSVSVFLTPFNGLFAPTLQSPMYKLFRFSES